MLEGASLTLALHGRGAWQHGVFQVGRGMSLRAVFGVMIERVRVPGPFVAGILVPLAA